MNDTLATEYSFKDPISYITSYLYKEVCMYVCACKLRIQIQNFSETYLHIQNIVCCAVPILRET